MLNQTEKRVVYLDGETLGYLHLTYTGERMYPVMRRLFSVLREGYINDRLMIPLSIDHISPYIEKNQINKSFLDMMGEIGQVQFHQRFTIKTLQLLRIINHFFENPNTKPVWRDAFTSDPEEKYRYGFNRYSSLTAFNVNQAISREKNYSQVFEFIENYKTGKLVQEIAVIHFNTLWEQFPDLIKPYFPVIGSAESHIKRFLANDEIRDIPEFNIIAAILYPMLDAYGIEHVEHGLRDEELFSAEIVASYLPYCHYYVTKVDVSEVLNMSGIPELYGVKIYDHNESSLYRLIQDIEEDFRADLTRKELLSRRSMFRKGGTKS
ncbi:MAG: hypothetical protein ACYC9O_08830 [Candidatus Latescibacterota bacterium]